ncbi:hypothetical protein SCLCIDRAFT_1223109 [Scleroderma citrinum Foug A]|uniref:Uncharacterized protein n=1 Tax=Scleroderma citrinum Foug A TaxID=1036808 RepID=A0A0C3D9R6_9AGAM|nr:hypothetical protein SCLCIDRAFT_1223109 [Scleroderma citrinum Foug A]
MEFVSIGMKAIRSILVPDPYSKANWSMIFLNPGYGPEPSSIGRINLARARCTSVFLPRWILRTYICQLSTMPVADNIRK